LVRRHKNARVFLGNAGSPFKY